VPASPVPAEQPADGATLAVVAGLAIAIGFVVAVLVGRKRRRPAAGPEP